METLHRLTEDEGRAQAFSYLLRLIGECPTELCWDATHHLQGHVRVGDRRLVVIAPRDAIHEPVVMTAEDWDAVRHAAGDDAVRLARRCAIHDADTLLALVS